MENKRTFEIEIPEIGEVTLEIDDTTLQEIISKDWADSFYTFNEKEAVEWLAWVLTEFPPGFLNDKHNVDGLADKTTDDLKITKNTLDYTVVWEDAKVIELKG